MAVYKDKKTGKWYFRVYVTDPLTNKRVQRQRSGFDLRRDALEAEAMLLADYKNKDIQLSNISYNDLIDEYLIFQNKRVQLTTYTAYVYMINNHITPFFENVKINDITRMLLEKWYKYVDSLNVKAEHKNRILGRLKNIFDYCEDQYGLRIRYLNTFPPFQNQNNFDTQNEKTIYDVDTFNKFVKHASNRLERTVCFVMFYTGVRVGELRALTWNDIHLDDNYIRVNKQVTSKVKGAGDLVIAPKTKSSIRNIQIPNILVDVLKEWYLDRTKQNRFNKNWQVFGDDGFITENRIRRFVRRISEKAGTPYITLHEFRHSYVSLLHSKGVDPKIIQTQAGHSSVNITLDIYTHIENEKSKQTIVDIFEKTTK